jgi:adenylate kinase
MNLILLGPPGAGKGSQAELLVEEIAIPHISTGDIFRAAISGGTPLGLEAKKYMDSGALVPDATVIGIVKERLNEKDCAGGFMLDGFPRTIPQADALDEYLRSTGRSLQAVINIEVEDEELLRRLTGRRVCRQCGAIYHIVTKPEQVSGKCDQCGGEVYQRNDDKPETVARRLEVYRAQTAPLIEYYRGKGLLLSFVSQGTAAELFTKVTQALGTLTR